MAKKFYAVREGYVPGIYETWDECKKQVIGFSGAIYKSFSTFDEAKLFISKINNDEKNLHPNMETESIAYVDGSYDSITNQFSCGVVFFHNGKEEHFSELFNDPNLAEMNNVAGEIKGAEKAIRYCLDHGIKSITIYHDYEGISKWCTGEWEAKKEGTKAYKEFYNNAVKRIDIYFVKVKGHSGDKYNEIADHLAKRAFDKSSFTEINYKDKSNIENDNIYKNKQVYINREEIINMINEKGKGLYDNFHANELIKVGIAYRCNLSVDNKKASLDFYFNKNGTTTINSLGPDTEISNAIKILLEDECDIASNMIGKTFTFKKLPQEWSDKLIEYLNTIVENGFEKTNFETIPKHVVYKFTSKMGDTLIINAYNNGTLTLQGKPAYLFREAISFLSYCESISVEEIVDSINCFHEVDVKINDVRNELETLLPYSYNNIDDMIIKLLSPSISLRKVKIDIEDYSCYAFPALRALEGYIKYLFDLKGIHVGNTFGGIFNNNNLTPSISNTISNLTYQNELERLYAFLKGNRHVVFHTEQILIGTHILEDKQEADDIVNQVINLIDTSYKNINT